MSYYLVLDSNIWVSERMLYSTLGSAALHVLTRGGGVIALPEIVSIEVDRVLIEQSAKAIDSVQKSTHFLRQLSGHVMSIMAPSEAAIRAGIEKRWKELSGILKPVPFTIDHARSALLRIIEKSPPCGPNNEQFRDCCIWQSAIDLAAECPVHLVTNDHAFYEGGNRSTLASALMAEIAKEGRKLSIHPNLSAFLASMDASAATIDERTIAEAIVAAVTPKAREIAGEGRKGGEFELGAVRKPRIIGYATPKPSIVAVSFSVTFDISRIQTDGDGERQILGRLSVGGTCSYDPKSGEITDVEIRDWSKSLDGTGQGFSGTFHPARDFSEQFTKDNIRII